MGDVANGTGDAADDTARTGSAEAPPPGQRPARRPVSDWATDFDHLSAEWAEHWAPISADLRGRCPVAHTDRFHGAYLVTRYDDCVTAAADTVTFSNRVTAVNENHPDRIRLEAPPITLDPPRHGPVRRALLPAFAPHAVERLVPHVEDACDDALDALAGRELVDGADDYARIIPVAVMTRLLGLPAGDADRFRGWVKGILSDGLIDLEIAARCTREVMAFFTGLLEERRARPGEDLVSWVAHAEVDDPDGTRPFTAREQTGILYLLLVAGIDTTWSAIGSALQHLARHPADRRRLAVDPSLLDTAVEEFLRFYSPVDMARLITAAGEVGGCPVRAGERMILSFGSANRDAAHFERPDEFLVDRAHNRHLAFGVGAHRCLGSNLGRMELRVALRRWLARYPEFEAAGPVRWSIGVRGPSSVPLRLLPPR